MSKYPVVEASAAAKPEPIEVAVGSAADAGTAETQVSALLLLSAIETRRVCGSAPVDLLFPALEGVAVGPVADVALVAGPAAEAKAASASPALCMVWM